ncbi:MAG: hypothetical protein C5S48_05560 [Candidatus Methanogaster sp.]|nr:MAG: hypothetical protein C5S48_05560 [ANME-2 cluster archaeon]
MQVATNKMVRALEEQAYLFKGHTLKELAITVKDYRDYLQSTKHAIVTGSDPTALLRKLLILMDSVVFERYRKKAVHTRF